MFYYDYPHIDLKFEKENKCILLIEQWNIRISAQNWSHDWWTTMNLSCDFFCGLEVNRNAHLLNHLWNVNHRISGCNVLVLQNLPILWPNFSMRWVEGIFHRIKIASRRWMGVISDVISFQKLSTHVGHAWFLQWKYSQSAGTVSWLWYSLVVGNFSTLLRF